MNKEQIAKESAKILLSTESVLVNTKDPFTYTSGAKGPVYVDCRRLISFVDERRQLMKFANEMLSDLNVDYVAGGETAGIPYGAFLSEELGKPMLYVRKKPKGFGRMAQIEGYFDETTKPNVMLVEDLQRDGGSKALCTWRDILAVAKEENIFDDETIESVRSFLKEPDAWSENFLKQAG